MAYTNSTHTETLSFHPKTLGRRKSGKKSGAGVTSSGKSKRSVPGRAALRTSYPRSRPGGAFSDELDSPESLSDDATPTDVNQHELQTINRQLQGLETMYSEVLKLLGVDREYLPGSRRSISSMSSAGRSRRSTHRHRSRDMKHINKRFGRLESHVVTLARSVAHLSSEMRTQSALYQEVTQLKQEVAELKLGQGSGGGPRGMSAEWEQFRGWMPTYTNPRRVKKLTQFFGQEPLLHIFLEKLGYKRYIANFESENITILELPYMNEQRLEQIGIPMGPRQRILQEAQLCFRQENFNIYIV